jgi:multiple sugar transport system permease protein
VHGYISLGGWTLQNYVHAWQQADFTTHFLNSVYITVPAVILTLFFASMVGFVIARFNWRFNIVMLGLFTAANLLPQQSLLIPLYRLSVNVPLPDWMSDSDLLYDSYWVLIIVNTAFQTGFCTFVLSNYMKTLPRELYEAAQVDGASIWKQYWTLTMPLCRPPLAALATLEVTWIYNEFFWATVLLRSGDKFPVTSSLNNLRGQFFTDNNLVSAGSVIVALPVIIIFFALQKHFVAGLTLGANKG